MKIYVVERKEVTGLEIKAKYVNEELFHHNFYDDKDVLVARIHSAGMTFYVKEVEQQSVLNDNVPHAKYRP